jgi:4-carboxymuconolactone decarboxylase
MDRELRDQGLQMRRKVLGADYVDKSFATADDFNRPFQEFLTEYCWGAIWTRPGLPPKTRSTLLLAMLPALNRAHELKLHIVGALNNGVTRDEMREIFMQVAAYCGAPAGVEAFKVAREVFAEIDAKK